MNHVPSDEPQYMIETQRFGRRWAWAISVPVPAGRPPNPGICRGAHPFASAATKRIGGWNNRVGFGWAWTQARAFKAGERAIDRHKRQRAGTAASQRTYAIKEYT